MKVSLALGITSSYAVQMQVDSHAYAALVADPGSGPMSGDDAHGDHEEHLPEGCTFFRGTVSICTKDAEGKETCKDKPGQCIGKKTQTGWDSLPKDLFTEKAIPENCDHWHEGFEMCMLIGDEVQHKNVPSRCFPTRKKSTSRWAKIPPEMPADCKMWSDGCNIYQVMGKSLFRNKCEEMKCDEPEEPACLEKKAEKPAMPGPVGPAPEEASNCLHWFDGCNYLTNRNGELFPHPGQRLKECGEDDKRKPFCNRKKPPVRPAGGSGPPKLEELGDAPEEAGKCLIWFDGCNTVKLVDGKMYKLGKKPLRECAEDKMKEPVCRNKR